MLFLLDHGLQVIDVHLPLHPFPLQFEGQFVVDVGGAVLALEVVLALLQEDSQLFAVVSQFLLKVELPLVVYYLILLVPAFHGHQDLLLSGSFLQQTLLVFEPSLEVTHLAPSLVDLVLVLLFEDAVFPNLFLH